MVQYLIYSIIMRFLRYSEIASQIFPLTRFSHSNTASCNTRSRMLVFKPFSVTTSTFIPSKLSNSRINRTGNQGLRFSPKYIKKLIRFAAICISFSPSYRTKNPHKRHVSPLFAGSFSLFFLQLLNTHRPIASINPF